MPNDTIDRGIKKAAGDSNADNYERITYEGYGPSGVAIIVETLTDNKNRTAGNVRSHFTKEAEVLEHRDVFLSCSIEKVRLSLIKKNVKWMQMI